MPCKGLSDGFGRIILRSGTLGWRNRKLSDDEFVLKREMEMQRLPDYLLNVGGVLPPRRFLAAASSQVEVSL